MPLDYSAAYLTSTLTENWSNPNTSRLALCNTALWSSDPTSEEIFASEITQANGYARQTNTPLAAATYNATTKEAEVTLNSVSVTASGGNVTYSGYSVIRNAGATSNKVATATNANNRITVTAHGLTAGDRVMLTADSGGTVPSGLNGLTFYYAGVVDANTIALYAEVGLTTLVAFTTDGTGTLRLRYCQGEDGPRKNLGSDRTIADGNSHNFNGLKAYRA